MTPEDEAWLEKPEVQRALAIIRENSRNAPESIRPTDNLELDLGFDSMQRVELLVEIEKELGGDVEEGQLAEIYTVRDLVNAVLESAASGKTVSKAQFAGWSAVLREEPTDPDVLDLARPHPIVESFWYFVTRVLQLIFRDRFQLTVSGLEKLPKTGTYILSSNHQSYLDPVALAAVLPRECFVNCFAVGTSEIFGAGIMRKLARAVRVVVVDPDANLMPAMRAGAYGLSHARNLILYPEGERSIDGTPRTFKKGAAILSVHMQVPIVPIAIDGFHDAWPRGKRFQKFAPLKMMIGDPIYPPPESEASEEAYAAHITKVKERVVEMWHELSGEADRARTRNESRRLAVCSAGALARERLTRPRPRSIHHRATETQRKPTLFFLCRDADFEVGIRSFWISSVSLRLCGERVLEILELSDFILLWDASGRTPPARASSKAVYNAGSWPAVRARAIPGSPANQRLPPACASQTRGAMCEDAHPATGPSPQQSSSRCAQRSAR